MSRDVKTCETCAKFHPRRELQGHMMGSCKEPKNMVSMSRGFEKTEPMYDMRWDYNTCDQHQTKDSEG